MSAPDLQKLYEQAHAFNMEEISPVDVMWLVETIRRLEAEKQESRRVGLEFALHLATETADWCIEEQEKGYLGAMRVADAIKRELSKPTAAQPVGTAKPESEKEGEL